MEHRFFAALTATALAQVMFYPVTVVRTQLQVVAPSTKVSKVGLAKMESLTSNLIVSERRVLRFCVFCATI